MARYITIGPDIASATFEVSMLAKKVVAELTYMGDCSPTLRHDPTSLEKGQVIFHWDANARSLTSGWYHLDLIVNGCPCQRFPVRVRNDCFAAFVDEAEYNDCYECDGLPKEAPLKCCSTVLKKDRCDVQICPTEGIGRPAKYVPSYDEV